MLFNHSSYPIREDRLEAHRFAWRKLAQPDTWRSARERVAIMAQAKQAQGDAELPADYKGVLPGKAANRTRDDLHHINRAYSPIDDAFTDGHYVEIASVYSILSNIDQFYRTLGIKLEPLPELQPGSPAQYVVDSHCCWSFCWLCVKLSPSRKNTFNS